ncbi:MAG: hypothetical protein ACYC9S_05020 [Leptospirales bacterium]
MKAPEFLSQKTEGSPSMPVWEGNLFSEPFPFRIFLFRQDISTLNGLLGWLDMWHSGYLTRTLSPFFRKEKTFPESFLLFPSIPPFHQGFLLMPVDVIPKGQLSRTIVRIVGGLKIRTVVVDVSGLSSELLMELESILDEMDPDRDPYRIYLSDPSDFPASCRIRISDGKVIGHSFQSS